MIKVVFSLFFIVSGILHPESVTTIGNTIFVSEIGKFYHQDGAIVRVVNHTPERIIKDLIDPKGITIYKNRLWITDINKVVSYSLKEHNIKIMPTNRFTPHPAFLNDICATENSLYVSDTEKNIVYRIQKSRATSFINIPKPNGIEYYKDRLFIASFTKTGKIYSVKGKTAKLFFSSEEIALTDGITAWKRADIMFASGFGSGKVLAISMSSGKTVGILGGFSNPADIFFDKSHNILFIPEMGKNRILAYKVYVRTP